MKKRKRNPALDLKNRDTLVQWLEQNRSIDPSTGCWLWLGPTSGKGYGSVSIASLGRHVYVHRLSAYLFLDFDLSSRLFVLHRCDTPACFCPDHLFIGTAGDNIRDCIAKGRFHNHNRARGERVNTSKLTEDQVRAIRREAANGQLGKVLAERFGVSTPMISSIVKRRSWKHVED